MRKAGAETTAPSLAVLRCRQNRVMDEMEKLLAR
jgi:hypothetical protein